MRRFGILVALTLVLAAAPASAQRLLGTTGQGGVGGTSMLVEIDPATGALVATIGDVGYLVNGLTWDASSGTLYATTSAGDATLGSGLITIDPLTGVGTPIGTGHGLGSGASVTATSNSAGQVYSWWDPNEDDLLLYNTTTGLATRVGESGIGTGAHGLAFNAADVLYLVNYGGAVLTINTTTGASTSVGTISGLPGSAAHHGDFNHTTGLYYGIATDPWAAGPRDIVVIDVGTLSVVSTMSTAIDGLHTLTFLDGAPLIAVNVPTVSPRGAIVMTLLLVVAGGILLRRFM